jgi:uncharacterized protein Yka (UPF0111/DUF47 family)
MNELILDMAREAAGGLLSYDEDGFKLSEKEVKKFAELIVKQCANIYTTIDNGNLHLGTDDYLEALYKTFRS